MSSQRSLEALPDGLQLLDKVIDVIQASCLLLMYSRANFEGSYHASSAAALTTQTNLGRKAYSHTRNWTVDAVESDLKPPKSDTLSVGSNFFFFFFESNLLSFVVLPYGRHYQNCSLTPMNQLPLLMNFYAAQLLSATRGVAQSGYPA